MRFALGVATGVAVAWAAIAIWQKIPVPMGDSDDGQCVCGCDDLGQIAYHGRVVPSEVYATNVTPARVTEEKVPHRYRNFPPAPVIDPDVHIVTGKRSFFGA